MSIRTIFDAIPCPEYLDIPFAGVSISDSFIRCIQFGKRKNSLFIEKYKETSIPPEVISAGQINKKEELIKLLQALKKDLHLEHVKVSLPEERAFLFTSRIPIVKREEVP